MKTHIRGHDIEAFPNGTLYHRQLFSVRYIGDRGYRSDWAEWNINTLTDPVEVGFSLSNGIITEIGTS